MKVLKNFRKNDGMSVVCLESHKQISKAKHQRSNAPKSSSDQVRQNDHFLSSYPTNFIMFSLVVLNQLHSSNLIYFQTSGGKDIASVAYDEYLWLLQKRNR
jgi:hypothetical protein